MSRLPRSAIISFVVIAIVNLCRLGFAKTPTTIDFGAQQLAQSRSAYGDWSDSNCPTQFTGFTIVGDQNDFSVDVSSLSNSCLNYKWGPNGQSYGSACLITATYTPMTPGAHSINITPVQGAGYNCSGIPTLYYYGAGVNLSGSLPVDVSSGGYDFDFGLELPSPQSISSPFSPEYSSVTFDSSNNSSACQGPGTPWACCTGLGTGACNASVGWTPKIQYQTSGKAPTKPLTPSLAPTPFTTTSANTDVTLGFGTPIPNASPSPTHSYPVVGGQLLIAAKYSVTPAPSPPVSNDPETNTLPAIMTGPLNPPGISYDAITEQLTTLYNTVTVTNDPSFNAQTSQQTTPTSELMAQVVAHESNSLQFKTIANTTYSVNGVWPHESGAIKNKKGQITTRAGVHIGLTQVPVTMADAWDWLQNTHDGVLLPNENSFQAKLNLAYNSFASSKIISNHPGLTPLTSCQLGKLCTGRCRGAIS